MEFGFYSTRIIISNVRSNYYLTDPIGFLCSIKHPLMFENHFIVHLTFLQMIKTAAKFQKECSKSQSAQNLKYCLQ